MIKGIQLGIVVSALVLATTACSSTPRPTPTVTVSLHCEDVRWSNVHEDKALTDIRVVVVGEDGASAETAVSDYPKQVEPSATAANKEVFVALVESLGQQVPGVETELGPPLASAEAIGDAPESGTYVIYAGASVITADYSGQCATAGNVPIAGSLRTWAHEVQGALQCGLGQTPPEGSLGAKVAIYCDSGT